jgi:hypothetical protein
LLHPPYTAWHLGHVLIGAGLAPSVDLVHLAATLLAFFLAVGVSAHALDEVCGRPLGTAIRDRTLWLVATVSLGAAVAIGIAGIVRVGWPLAVFVVLGAWLVVAYNLELLGGLVHTDLGFALAWGAFPTLVAYVAQTGRIDGAVVLVAAATASLSWAQRALSTPVRHLRRRVATFTVEVRTHDGEVTTGGPQVLLAPIERALAALSWGVVTLGVGMVVGRLG